MVKQSSIEKKTEKYYIDGKKYDTGHSDLICSYRENFDMWLPDGEELYRTPKGAYFRVSKNKGIVDVSVIAWIPETHNYGIGITLRPPVMRVMA
jgi:hypothetical protein